ncbi:hypothetical protein ACJX0J_005327, partial [Zea mays]
WLFNNCLWPKGYEHLLWMVEIHAALKPHDLYAQQHEGTKTKEKHPKPVVREVARIAFIGIDAIGAFIPGHVLLKMGEYGQDPFAQQEEKGWVFEPHENIIILKSGCFVIASTQILEVYNCLLLKATNMSKNSFYALYHLYLLFFTDLMIVKVVIGFQKISDTCPKGQQVNATTKTQIPIYLQSTYSYLKKKKKKRKLPDELKTDSRVNNDKNYIKDS